VPPREGSCPLQSGGAMGFLSPPSYDGRAFFRDFFETLLQLCNPAFDRGSPEIDAVADRDEWNFFSLDQFVNAVLRQPGFSNYVSHGPEPELAPLGSLQLDTSRSPLRSDLRR
jgi:hypothetical protein